MAPILFVMYQQKLESSLVLLHRPIHGVVSLLMDCGEIQMGMYI